MLTPGTARLARSARRARSQHVAPEKGLHEDDGEEGDGEHEETEDGDGPELALLLEVEDDHGHDLGVRREEEDGGRQLTDHPDEDEAPGRDDAASGERRGDLPEHAEPPRPENASRLF